MNEPMLVKSAYGWHVLSEDGQKFDLIPQECSVRYNGAGLKGIRGTREDIDLVQHWQNEVIRAEYLRQRLEDKTNSLRVEIAAKQGAHNEIRIMEMALRRAVRALDEEQAIQPESQIHHEMQDALPFA